MRHICKLSALIFCMVLVVLLANGITGVVTDYLIINDIDGYKFMGKGGGKGSGTLV